MEHKVQYPKAQRSKFRFHETDETQWSAVSLVTAMNNLGGPRNIGIRSNTVCCINLLETAAGSPNSKRQKPVVQSCQRYEAKAPDDLSDIEGFQKDSGKYLLSRQEYNALVANDLRFLNVLQAMIGDVHQIPTDKDKCCVLMAIRPTQCPNQSFRSFEPKIRFSHSPQPLVLLPAPRPRGRH